MDCIALCGINFTQILSKAVSMYLTLLRRNIADSSSTQVNNYLNDTTSP